MRNQCAMCEFEQGGFCSVRKNHGVSIKRKAGKKRNCSAYKEDTLRVLAEFRRREKKMLERQAAQLRTALDKREK